MRISQSEGEYSIDASAMQIQSDCVKQGKRHVVLETVQCQELVWNGKSSLLELKDSKPATIQQETAKP